MVFAGFGAVKEGKKKMQYHPARGPGWNLMAKMSSGRWSRAAVFMVILAVMAPQLGSALPSVRMCHRIPPVLAVARTVRSDRRLRAGVRSCVSCFPAPSPDLAGSTLAIAQPLNPVRAPTAGFG